MKQRVVLFLTLSLFIFFGSCSSDDDSQPATKDEMTETIQNDIDSRFPLHDLKYTWKYTDGLLSINLLDENGYEAELLYKNNEFQAEYKRIADLKDLPEKVQSAFASLSVEGIHDLKIYKTERSYIKYNLYTFKFLQTTSKITNLVYNIFINDDGTILYSINRDINDAIMLYPNYMKAFDYVAKKYTGAVVRCQLNDAGSELLIINQDNYLKFVSFDYDKDKDSVSWKETRYELPADYKVSTKVLESLKKADPEFTYTNIERVEKPDENFFLFSNNTIKSGVSGYYIADN